MSFLANRNVRIFNSTMSVSTLNTSAMAISTLTGSTMNASSINVSTLSGSTLNASTMTGNQITISTLTVSSINNGTPGVAAYSTFNASSINVASTITTSTLVVNTGSLTVSGLTSVGNRLLGSVDGSNVFWTGLRGSGSEGDRLAMGLVGDATTGAVSQITLNKPIICSSNVSVNGNITKLGNTVGNDLRLEGGTATNSGYVSFIHGNISRGYIGNANATDMFIAAQNGAQLSVDVGGTRRLSIDTSGITTISSKELRISNPSSAAGGQLRLTNGTTGYGMMLYNDGSGFFFLITNNNDVNGNFNGLRPLYITQSTGRVTMENGLNVSGNILLAGAGSNCTGINMPTGGYGLTWGIGYSRIYDDGDIRICTDDTMHFYTGSNTTTPGTEVMTINPSAYVGIGIASPDAPLHIYKSVARSYPASGTLDLQFAMTSVNGGRWYFAHNQSINSNLYFIANVNTNSFTTLDVCGFVENDTAGVTRMNFTGQHRCAYDSSIDVSTSEGLIVRATGTYWSLTDLYDNTSPIDHITINESLPQITLVREANCPSVFGAISFTEDTNSTRKHRAGRFTSVYANPFGEKKRVFVNALGEGAVWVCNINGNFTIGDLITTSTVPGYGMLQSSTQILNYTFGKITMDCDFQPALCPVQKVRTKQESKTTIEELFEDQITEETTTEIVFDEETQHYVQKKITKQTTKQVPLSDSFPLYDESGAVIGNHTVPRKGPKTTVSTVEDRDADGNVQWDPSLDANGVPLTKPAYQLRYLDADGTILTKDQYDTRIQNGQPAYLAAFVGCIYLCG